MQPGSLRPMTFGDRLLAVTERRGRLCVGIDPHPQLMRDWGLPVTVEGLRRFTDICVEAFGPVAALVKPQVAFFEAFGSAGLAVLERAVPRLRAAGALVLADAKRGDIGSTMAAYAAAWLGEDSPLAADAVTVSPYLGVGALAPALELAERTGRGVFVLAATSNPEATVVQGCRMLTDGRRVSQLVVDEVASWNRAAVAEGRVGSVGVVVGATVLDPPDLRALGGPILLPGVGAQGGGVEDIRRISGGAGNLAGGVPATRIALPSVSREILRQGPQVAALQRAVAETSAPFEV